MDKIRHTFRKEERLCSRKIIALLFNEGHHIMVYPVKLLWKEQEAETLCPVRIAFTVSSKTYRKAVDRNLLKRRMREAYRLNKPPADAWPGEKSINLMVIYIAKEILPYSSLEKAIRSGLKRIGRHLIEQNGKPGNL